ncbi:MAG: MBL fold metallo-hydrolase [Planctomycetes bacterium]|nr:MBL fold metallo-hydrolase [Planctomycetota bacterium]
MRITFLGGAESVGASCLLLEVDDRRWVADCGVRLKGSGAERLPDLSVLEQTGAPTAVLVTHAHLDHIGALPVLHQRFPHVPVYATAPTIALTRVQLLDSLKIMEEEASVDGELPLYSLAAVESLLEHMVPVVPHRPMRPDPGGPEVTFVPSGHILGACSICVEAREGRVFLSGDVSVDNQRTIPGMRAPRFRADLVVLESTYGSRLHPARSAEEARLAETVAAAVAGGGKVLIPAFAIGRAQEVILILLRAQLLGQIPKFPVHVDGMVRRACGVYAEHPAFLQSTLKKRVEKHGDPFFGVLDTVRPVRSPGDRAAVLAGPPCAIVASSGMLTGGPSPFYARALLDDPRSLIAITGYQDEESPGRRLLEAASGVAETIALDGQEVRPRARIASYALSGHASGAQLAALARALEPAEVLLVHGDLGARRELANLLSRERAGRAHLPGHGEPIELLGRRRAGGAAAGTAVRPGAGSAAAGAAGEDPEAIDLGALAEAAVRARPGGAFTAAELHALARGRPPEPEEAARFEALLAGSGASGTSGTSGPFEPHPMRPFHFRVREPGSPGPAAPSFLDPTALGARIDAALPADSGLLRKSYQPGESRMVLVFAFPEIAEARHRAALESVFEGTGWTFELHRQPNLAALDRELRAALPDPSLLAKSPSVRIEERAVMVQLVRPPAREEEAAWAAAAARVRERTGFAVSWAVREGTAPAKQPRDACGRLEVNLAYRAVHESFAGERHRPHRVGLRSAAPGEEPAIEVAFISPEVGARYREKLDRLSAEIGWRLVVARVPDQNAILQTARELLRAAAIRKGPSYHAGDRKVSVTIAGAMDSAEAARLGEELAERTGFRLELISS